MSAGLAAEYPSGHRPVLRSRLQPAGELQQRTSRYQPITLVLDRPQLASLDEPEDSGTAHAEHSRRLLGPVEQSPHHAALPIAETSAARASRARRLASVSARSQWSLSATAC